MISEGVHKYALSRATELALSLQKFEKASDFIEAMHEGGYPIRQHYFWPMFAKSTCEKGMRRTLFFTNTCVILCNIQLNCCYRRL